MYIYIYTTLRDFHFKNAVVYVVGRTVRVIMGMCAMKCCAGRYSVRQKLREERDRLRHAQIMAVSVLGDTTRKVELELKNKQDMHTHLKILSRQCGGSEVDVDTVLKELDFDVRETTATNGGKTGSM